MGTNFKDMSMQNGPGRTYRYLDPAFGPGLSYTTFELNCASPPVILVDARSSTSFKVTVSNTGVVDGTEVVQAYIRPPRSLPTLESEAPIVQKQLVAFERVAVAAGEQASVT